MSEDTKVEATNDLLVAYGQLFAELLETQRFKDFLATFYTLTKVVDDANKTVHFSLIENPPEIVATKVQKQLLNEQTKIQVTTATTPALTKALSKSMRKQAKK